MSKRKTVEIVSRSGLMGGEPCFAGTRIPALTIRHFMEGRDGYSGEEIIDMYPSLAGLDIDGWSTDE